MSAKTDKAEIVDAIKRAVASAGLPELPYEILHKADAITLNIFYDRWLTVVLGRINGQGTILKAFAAIHSPHGRNATATNVAARDDASSAIDDE